MRQLDCVYEEKSKEYRPRPDTNPLSREQIDLSPVGLAWSLLGEMRQIEGDLDGALVAYNEALKQGAMSALVLAKRALIYA